MNLVTNSPKLLLKITGGSVASGIEKATDAARRGAMTAGDAPRPLRYCRWEHVWYELEFRVGFRFGLGLGSV